MANKRHFKLNMQRAIKAKIGFGDTDEDTYRLQEERIDTITDDEIRLRDDR